MMTRFLGKSCWLAALVMVEASAQAQLSGTSEHIPVPGANYARGAGIILNNSGLLTFRASFNRVLQGTIPTVNYFYPGNFKAPDGGDMDLLYYYVTPSGSLAVVSHTGSTLRRGIFFIKGTTVRKIAYTQESAPGGGVFSSLGDPSANDAGQVAFAASTQGGPGSGIFLGDANGLHAIALYTDNAPGGAGTFTGFSSGVIMTTGGKVAFYAATSGGEGGGVYLGTTSGVSLIPLTNGAGNILFNNSDQALFRAHGNLYLGTTSSSHVIVSLGDAAPGGGTFSTIQNAILNDAGEVAFSAYVKRDSTVEGVFLWTPSGIKLIAQSGLAPGGGTFRIASLFNAFPVLNNNGQVAFTANTSSGARLFLGNGASLIKVVGTGDIVSGLIVQNVVLPPPEDGGSGHSAFNDKGELAYDVVFKQGSYFDELYVFTLDPPKPGSLGNISTRLSVGTGDNALIGGFIITGSQPKKVIIRGVGPSLNVADKLANPTLELRNSSGALLDSNDNWVDSPNKQAIIDSTVPPTNDLEAAIVATLPANNSSYTAILRGANNGTGIGVVEAYDLDQTVDSKLANISTRGFVNTGDNVMIGGTIIIGSTPARVLIRAIGPSLTTVPNALQDPTLELHDGNGALLEANDNWQDSPNKQAIIDSTIPPTDNRESAILGNLQPGQYIVIVRGSANSTGVALVEAYQLQ